MGDTIFSSLCGQSFAFPGILAGVLRFRRRRVRLDRHIKMQVVNNMYGGTGNARGGVCVVEIVCICDCMQICTWYYPDRDGVIDCVFEIVRARACVTS